MKLLLTLLGIFIIFNSVLANPFKSGYYYTKDGRKIEGFINFRRATFTTFGSRRSYILFKVNKDSSAQKFTTDDISSFIIGKDSFTIVYNIKINSMQGEYKEDFVKVIISGRINLFLHMSSADNPEIDRYVLSKDNKNFLGIWNARQQRKEIASLFSEDPDLQSKILNKEFDKFKDIPALVNEYNSKSN